VSATSKATKESAAVKKPSKKTPVKVVKKATKKPWWQFW